MTDLHSDRILILDFGAQYTQLIARRIRELGVYCEIWAWDHDPAEIAAFGAKGIILSGGPESTTLPGAPRAPQQVFDSGLPILGICYGLQTMAVQLGGATLTTTQLVLLALAATVALGLYLFLTRTSFGLATRATTSDPTVARLLGVKVNRVYVFSWGVAGLLSGGQQKQVEFARSLMVSPEVVLLDELSMGLDPKTTSTVFEQVVRMRDAGVAVLLVEQNARRALETADIGCVLDLGRVHITGPAPELLADPQLSELYLGGRPAERSLSQNG